MVITYKNNRNNIYYKTVYIHEELFFTTSRWFFFISTPCKVRNLTRILLHRKLSSLSRMSQISVSENLVIHVIHWRSYVWEVIMHVMIHCSSRFSQNPAWVILVINVFQWSTWWSCVWKHLSWIRWEPRCPWV